MGKINKMFTLKEVEKLTKNAYEVGFCDGVESRGNDKAKEYRNAEDFWNKNIKKWTTVEITYVV